jgi:ATP-binding cassette subfamily C protein CydC
VLSPAGIILLDEPTEHLDAADASHVLHALLGDEPRLLSADKTVVVATHHLPDDLRCAKLSITRAAGAA